MSQIQYLAILGLVLCTYAFMVQVRLKRSKNYKPFCDFTKNISCSKALGGKYSGILGVPNSLLGIAYFAAVWWIDTLNNPNILVLISLIAVVYMLVYAYIMIRQKNICVICTLIHLINIVILVLAALQVRGSIALA